MALRAYNGFTVDTLHRKFNCDLSLSCH